jgi:hypothetical protein
MAGNNLDACNVFPLTLAAKTMFKGDVPTMKKSIRNIVALSLILSTLAFAIPGQALAYTCEAVYEAAETLIEQAEALVKPDTDSRILAMIEQAKGLADGGIASHRRASEGHTGDVGKFMHGDAVRIGRQAQDLAREALFLLTGNLE